MEKISSKEQAYLQKWQRIREKKSRFVLQQGLLLWGLPSGVVSYFFNIGFKMNQFQVADFMLQLFVFLVVGIGIGYLQYRGQEQRFQHLSSQLNIKLKSKA